MRVPGWARTGWAGVAILGLAAALVLGTLTAPVAPQAAAATPSTVSVDLGRSLGAFPFRPGRQLSATPHSWRHGVGTWSRIEQLGLSHVRVWLKFTDAYDVTTRTPNYARWYDYLDAHHSRADKVILNWQTNYELVTSGRFTKAELAAAQRDLIAHYKRRYPRIEYIEAENEPADIDAYYPKYTFLYQVVNSLAGQGLPGPRLQIGGPTTDIFTELRIGRFLDHYARDTDPGKRLDFVSYHQYLVNTVDGRPWDYLKTRPATVATERARLDDLLRARGLATRPALVTETGVFPQLRATDAGLEADWHIQAAGLASLHYHYAGQRGVTPLHWTLDHPENDRKDMFTDLASGVPRPYYAMIRMQSMLPPTRYQASSDTLSPDGLGVYGLAGATADRVAVMTWNYQWTRTGRYDSRVVLTNLPAAFRTANVLVERYRIPAGQHSGDLQRVESFVIGPRTAGSYHGQTLPLEPNELRLLVLTPTTAPPTS